MTVASPITSLRSGLHWVELKGVLGSLGTAYSVLFVLLLGGQGAEEGCREAVPLGVIVRVMILPLTEVGGYLGLKARLLGSYGM
ncbi:hypothetical protein BHM03_00045112 [Ensete ventricosum]|nr:hypothetical protein BHM03_00045112 [Ensete ventricosum]